MKIKDIIANLDKSEANRCDSITWDMDDLARECNLEMYNLQQERDNPRLKSYWLGNHICTDTWVGLRAYFLDGAFVILSMQKGRKCDEDYEWVSEEAYFKVREYLLSLDEAENLDPPKGFVDMEEELGDGYPIEYTGQCLKKEVLYKNKLVTIVKDNGEGYNNFHTITVEEQDTGIQEDIDVRNILVPWYIVEEDK